MYSCRPNPTQFSTSGSNYTMLHLFIQCYIFSYNGVAIYLSKTLLMKNCCWCQSCVTLVLLLSISYLKFPRQQCWQSYKHVKCVWSGIIDNRVANMSGNSFSARANNIWFCNQWSIVCSCYEGRQLSLNNCEFSLKYAMWYLISKHEYFISSFHHWITYCLMIFWRWWACHLFLLTKAELPVLNWCVW